MGMLMQSAEIVLELVVFSWAVCLPVDAFIVSRIVWHDEDTGRAAGEVGVHRMKGGR